MVSVGQSRAGASRSRLCQEFPGTARGGCVKILFDANTPAPLARFLRGHEVVRADELEWQGLENGALLDAAGGTSNLRSERPVPAESYDP